MAKNRLVVFICAIFFLFPGIAHTAGFSNIVVFGDSLSDNGNLFQITQGAIPPPPYFKGRFSNGPVWVEYIAQDLGLTGIFSDFAVGGAETDNSNVLGSYPGVLSEVNSYLNLSQTAGDYPGALPTPDDTLFILWAGGNDLLQASTNPLALVSEAVANISTALGMLKDAGANQFLVVNMPDLGAVPRLNKTAAHVFATLLAVDFNTALSTALDEFQAENPQIQIIRLDSFALLRDIIQNYEAYGFDNVTDSQLNMTDGTVQQGNYLFWDDVHPTTKGHRLLAEKALQLISCDTCTGSHNAVLGADLVLTIPMLEFAGADYGCRLIPVIIPGQESSFFWKLDPNSVTLK